MNDQQNPQGSNQHNQPQPTEGRQVKVTVPTDRIPTFSNSVQINVNDDSVVLQFLYIRPNTDQAALVAEVAITPQHAIKFQKTLDDTIKRHFTRHLDGGQGGTQ
jgi:hypothetical protein